MKLGIITAIRREAALVLEKLEQRVELAAPFPGWSGMLEGHCVVVIISGLGKANAAAATQRLIDKHQVDEVVNLGICGGLKPGQQIAEVLLSTEFVQHDFNLRMDGKHSAWHPSYDSHLLQTQSPRCVGYQGECIMASGDRFINSQVLKDELIEATGAAGCDMESAAIAQVCLRHQIPFISIRGVSDIAEELPENFEQNMEQAIRTASDKLLTGLAANR